MVKTLNKYDTTLEFALAQVGLNHTYYTFGEYDFCYDSHVIERWEKKKFLGFIPYTKKTPVAMVNSEPKFAKDRHFLSNLKYSGLEICVTDPKAEEAIKIVCEKVGKELGEPITVLKKGNLKYQ